jgi:hypothetical protein
MFYNSEAELENIVLNSGTTIVLEKDISRLEKIFKTAFIIHPNTDKNQSGKIIRGISVGQMQEVVQMTTMRAAKPRIFIIENADSILPQAQNTCLKIFEEPKENYHFVLQTTHPEALLPTIRSRAFIYAPKQENVLETPPEAEKEVFDTAKRLLVADTAGIIDIAEELQKRKETEKSPRRDFALKVIETTIELAEKSYFKTGNKVFTKKIKGLIIAHKNIKENGIIRLQLVANLV